MKLLVTFKNGIKTPKHNWKRVRIPNVTSYKVEDGQLHVVHTYGGREFESAYQIDEVEKFEEC